MDELLGRLVAALGDVPVVRAAGRELLNRYSEPQRRYHSLEHLTEMFHALDRLVATVPPAVTCAVFWHDAVYDPTAPDSEERSAKLAGAQLPALGADPVLVEETVRLVRLTAGHRPASGDEAGAVLCDADLAVLAAPAERYDRYAAAVREEYRHVSDADWRRGRADVLTRLLEGGLYRTRAARGWEEPAGDNVRRELRSLRS